MRLSDGRLLVDKFVGRYFTEEQRMPSRFDLLKYSVKKASLDGLFLEFGVWKGDSIRFLAKTLPDKHFYGFDTFKGLPEKWSEFYPKGHMGLNETPKVPVNVTLIEGLFQETLAPFLEEHVEPASFVHLDADLYSSTKYVLFTLADNDRLKTGTILEFDEVFYQDSPDTMLDDEHRVYNEFIEAYDVDVQWLRFFQKRATTRASLVIERFEG